MDYLRQTMRVKQIASEFGVAPSTVWNYSKNGILTPIKITKGITIFERREVEALFCSKIKDIEKEDLKTQIELKYGVRK